MTLRRVEDCVTMEKGILMETLYDWLLGNRVLKNSMVAYLLKKFNAFWKYKINCLVYKARYRIIT